MAEDASKSLPPRFESISRLDVPSGREGKHKPIVIEILAQLELLEPSSALKIPLSALPDSKENIRSALNRATRQQGLEIASSSDQDHLYIWKVLPD